MQSQPIYLDYAATTPVDPRVAEAMSECLTAEGIFGNPASSTHEFGRAAAARVARARERVASLIGARPAEIVFTSGATESNNLALIGVLRANRDRGRHLITFRTEHKAVIDPARQLEKEGFVVTWLTPDADGIVDPEAVRGALRDETLLVSVMHVNNEIGVIADIAAIAAICRERNVLFHTDASQSVGRVPVDVAAVGADLLSMTAHKIYGPKGVGALWVGERARPWLKPVLFGGGQERGLRPGTLPTHQIEGFGLACELAAAALATEPARIQGLRQRLWAAIAGLGGLHRNGSAAASVGHILNVSFEGVEGDSLVAALGGLAVATGSACTSATREPSYVLRALGRSAALAQSSLRYSFGRPTTAAAVDRAAAVVINAVERLRAVTPGGPVQPRVAAAERVERPFEPLSPEVRALFDTTPGAGAFPPEAGVVVVGEAGSEAAEAQVRFSLVVAGDTVKDARFQAWGCPHTLAAAAWITAQLPGRRRDALVPGTPETWRAVLGVPIEKLGRLLVVEDALQDCRRHWPGEALT